MPEIKKLGSRLLLLRAALVVAWLGVTTLALYVKRTQLLIGFDGGYMLNLAQRQFEWHVPLLSSSMDWFQGLGDVFFAVNFRLLPGFIIGSLFASATAAKVAIYEVVLCELSFAIIMFGISLGVSTTVGVAAALVICLTFLPFAHPTLIYGILPLAPHMGSLIAAALLAAAAFLQFGRRSWLTDLPFAVIVLALLAWSVLVSVTILMLAAPFLLLCVVSGIVAAQSRHERLCKIALFAAAGLFLVAGGPAIYLVSTILDTAAVTFPAELANDRGTFYFASILFHWNHLAVGPILMIFGIVGAVLAAFDRRRPVLRIFAITLLTYVGSRLTFAILIIIFDFWRGPAALYFEFFVIPLYAIFAVLFWATILERLWRLRGWPSPTVAVLEPELVGAAIVVVLVLVISTPRQDYGFPYPPRSSQITNILAQETGLPLGSAFRGRTVDMIGASISRNVDWLNLHAIDGSLADATGNELRLVGLHYFGIPGFFQYTPTISPFLYAVTTRLLALPGDKQMRNVLVLRKNDPRILAMLGVRFVITDCPNTVWGGACAGALNGKGAVFLDEVAKPNLGDYSPTEVRKIATAAGIIARLADPNFDPTREIIADLPSDTKPLMPARNARLTFFGDSLRVQAESDGESVLLMPLEFSHCLEADTGATGTPVLVRANLVETGILFSGRLDTRLSVHTGPFLNPSCRLRDLFDARALRVGEVPQPRS
jgi:hypothetical protein